MVAETQNQFGSLFNWFLVFARCHLKDLVVELSLSLDNLNGNLLVLRKFYKETQSNRLQILDYLVVKFRRLKGHLCF